MTTSRVYAFWHIMSMQSYTFRHIQPNKHWAQSGILRYFKTRRTIIIDVANVDDERTVNALAPIIVAYSSVIDSTLGLRCRSFGCRRRVQSLIMYSSDAPPKKKTESNRSNRSNRHVKNCVSRGEIFATSGGNKLSANWWLILNAVLRRLPFPKIFHSMTVIL